MFISDELAGELYDRLNGASSEHHVQAIRAHNAGDWRDRDWQEKQRNRINATMHKLEKAMEEQHVEL